MGHFLRQKLQHLKLLTQAELRAGLDPIVRLGMMLPRPLAALLGSRFALALRARSRDVIITASRLRRARGADAAEWVIAVCILFHHLTANAVKTAAAPSSASVAVGRLWREVWYHAQLPGRARHSSYFSPCRATWCPLYNS